MMSFIALELADRNQSLQNEIKDLQKQVAHLEKRNYELQEQKETLEDRFNTICDQRDSMANACDELMDERDKYHEDNVTLQNVITTKENLNQVYQSSMQVLYNTNQKLHNKLHGKECALESANEIIDELSQEIENLKAHFEQTEDPDLEDEVTLKPGQIVECDVYGRGEVVRKHPYLDLFLVSFDTSLIDWNYNPDGTMYNMDDPQTVLRVLEDPNDELPEDYDESEDPSVYAEVIGGISAIRVGE